MGWVTDGDAPSAPAPASNEPAIIVRATSFVQSQGFSVPENPVGVGRHGTEGSCAGVDDPGQLISFSELEQEQTEETEFQISSLFSPFPPVHVSSSQKKTPTARSIISSSGIIVSVNGSSGSANMIASCTTACLPIGISRISRTTSKLFAKSASD